jgi:hypothetical protein
VKRLDGDEVEREIAALDSLEIKALRVRWADLYGREPPPRMRAGLLRLGIAYRLQEKAFGGLKPQTVRLLRKLAAELRAERAAKLASGAAAGRRSGFDPSRAPAAGLLLSPGPKLSPGTRLLREWNGTMEAVDVVAGGYHWRGKDYRTLSAVAGAITGSKWSGPRFFGLRGNASGRMSASLSRGSPAAARSGSGQASGVSVPPHSTMPVSASHLPARPSASTNNPLAGATDEPPSGGAPAGAPADVVPAGDHLVDPSGDELDAALSAEVPA